MRTAMFISLMTSTDTTRSWRRSWLRAIPIRKDCGQLPSSNAPHIYVHKIRCCVIADTASMQREGRIPQLCGRNSRHADVDGHRLHVKTVAGHTVSMRAQEFVTPRSAVTANDINFKIGIPERRGQFVE